MHLFCSPWGTHSAALVSRLTRTDAHSAPGSSRSWNSAPPMINGFSIPKDLFFFASFNYLFFFLNLTFTMQCKCVGMLRSNLCFEEVSESIKTCGWPGGDGLKFVIFWHVYLTKVTLSCPCLYTFSESAGIKVSISDYS